MVELRDAVGQHERVVVRHAAHPSAQPDVLRQGDGLGDEQLGGGNVLPFRGEVLTDPGFGEAKLVELDDLLQIGFEGRGEVRARRVQGHRE